MRLGVLCYHKNADVIYPKAWIDKFRESILNQTYQDFEIFEVEYGRGNFRIFDNSIYESKKLPSFVDAMNYLLDKIFAAGYDCACNTNSDDFFSLNCFEKQIPYIEKGYDIVSSNFALIKDGEKILTHYFDKMDLKEHLDKDHNIICHPVVMYSRKFWENNRYVPELVPVEDLRLWQVALANGFKFKILPDVLCFHRLHNNSVGHNLKET